MFFILNFLFKIKILTGYKSIFNKSEWIFIIFSKTLCPICFNLEPEFNRTAKLFKNNPNISFSHINCDKYRYLCSFFFVSGVPKILIFNSKKISYQIVKGPKNSEYFIDFIKNFTGLTPRSNYSKIIFKDSTNLSLLIDREYCVASYFHSGYIPKIVRKVFDHFYNIKEFVPVTIDLSNKDDMKTSSNSSLFQSNLVLFSAGQTKFINISTQFEIIYGKIFSLCFGAERKLLHNFIDDILNNETPYDIPSCFSDIYHTNIYTEFVKSMFLNSKESIEENLEKLRLSITNVKMNPETKKRLKTRILTLLIILEMKNLNYL